MRIAPPCWLLSSEAAVVWTSLFVFSAVLWLLAAIASTGPSGAALLPPAAPAWEPGLALLRARPVPVWQASRTLEIRVRTADRESFLQTTRRHVAALNGYVTPESEKGVYPLELVAPRVYAARLLAHDRSGATDYPALLADLERLVRQHTAAPPPADTALLLRVRSGGAGLERLRPARPTPYVLGASGLLLVSFLALAWYLLHRLGALREAMARAGGRC